MLRMPLCFEDSRYKKSKQSEQKSKLIFKVKT